MDTIKFPYRSSRHLPLLYVIGDAGTWEDQDLDVEYDEFVSRLDSHDALVNQEVAFIGGNHISPYATRARGGDWIYLGQTVKFIQHRYATRDGSGITSVDDIVGKTIAQGSGVHPALDERLLLNRHGLYEEEGDFEFFTVDDDTTIAEAVLNGDADAALVRAPTDLLAEKVDLDVVDIFDPLHMVHGTTISTTKSYVEENEDLTIRFIKGLLAGMAYYINNREESIKMIQKRCDPDHEFAKDLYSRFSDEIEFNVPAKELATHLYEAKREELSPKLYPSPQSIVNVYQEAVWWNEDAKEIEPFEVWDFQYLRDIIDDGYVDELYN